MNAPQLWQELGNTYLKLGVVDQAVNAYRKVVEPFGSEKEKALGWRMVADLYLELNEPDLAAEAFIQAAKLFVSQPVDETPAAATDVDPAEALPAVENEIADQTPLEGETLIVEGQATAQGPDPVATVIEQQVEQSEALSFEQLPLGIPGSETVEPVTTPVDAEALEPAIDSHPDQLELDLEAVAAEAAPAVEALAASEPVAAIAEESEPVEPEAVITSVDAQAVVSEAPVESVAQVEVDEPTVVDEIAPAIAEEIDAAPVEVESLVTSEPQLTLVDVAPVVVEAVTPVFDVSSPEQPAAEVVVVASEEAQQPGAEASVAESPAVDESAPVAEESAPEVVASDQPQVEVAEPMIETVGAPEIGAQGVIVTEEVLAEGEAVNEPEVVALTADESEPRAIVEAQASAALSNTEVVTEEQLVVAGAEQQIGDPEATNPIEVAIDLIVPNPYVVLHTAGMDELVETIRNEGLTHPLIVTPNVWNNKYLLLVGEWRLEAARRAGLQSVPVLVRDVNPKEFLELTLLQNAQQPYLNPLEVAQLYQFLLQDFQLPLEAIAERVGRSPLAVENTLRLQNLTPNGQKALIEHVISEDHAQALLRLATPEEQDAVLGAIIDNEMSIQRTLDYVSEINVRGLQELQPQDQKPAIEIIVENEETPNQDVAWLDDNQPLATERKEETIEFIAVETPTAETPASESSSDLPTITVDNEDANQPGEARESTHASEEVPADSEGAYPISLPGTLADIRKNVLMAWKLESDSMPGTAYSAPAKMEMASETGTVAVMNQVEVVTARTIYLPDTKAILTSMDEQALANAVEEVVIPVVEEVHVTAPAVQEPLVEEPAPVAAPVGDQPVATEATEALEESVNAETPTETEARPLSREEEAIAVYARVTELNPTNDRAWHMLGNLLLDLGRLDEAVSALEVAISLNASRDIYYYHLGIAQAVQKNYEDAVQSFERALTLNPNNIFAHCSIIGYYRKLGREAEAEQHFQLVAPNIKLEKAYNRACFESICGNTDAALELLRQAIENDHVPVKWIERDPDLDLVRDDPRYRALIASVTADAI